KHTADSHGDADEDQAERDKLLMVRLASLRAIRDQEQEPKECGSEKADEDKGDSQHDSHDRLHGVATGSSLRCLDVDHEPCGITELEGADARCLRHTGAPAQDRLEVAKLFDFLN